MIIQLQSKSQCEHDGLTIHEAYDPTFVNRKYYSYVELRSIANSLSIPLKDVEEPGQFDMTVYTSLASVRTNPAEPGIKCIEIDTAPHLLRLIAMRHDLEAANETLRKIQMVQNGEVKL